MVGHPEEGFGARRGTGRASHAIMYAKKKTRNLRASGCIRPMSSVHTSHMRRVSAPRAPGSCAAAHAASRFSYSTSRLTCLCVSLTRCQSRSDVCHEADTWCTRCSEWRDWRVCQSLVCAPSLPCACSAAYASSTKRSKKRSTSRTCYTCGGRGRARCPRGRAGHTNGAGGAHHLDGLRRERLEPTAVVQVVQRQVHALPVVVAEPDRFGVAEVGRAGAVARVVMPLVARALLQRPLGARRGAPI